MHSLFWGLLVIIIGILVYLLVRLKKLEDLIKGYHLKNQEGAGALSKSRNPLYLFCALVCFLPNVITWLLAGFSKYSWIGLLPVLLFLYLYACQNEDK
ncbi:hypothetical protein K6V78_01095 [Streptococcus gallolyticus]|nr:hypothetical protein [Streptococcus gallolyticus]MBY5040152.1 hypothetical protein [Streptococcus gallolyticus]